jgi:hypothetical protein
MTSILIDRDHIVAVERVIRPYIRRTPVIAVDSGDFGLDTGNITFKLELLQHGGSFKARGAFTHLLTRRIPSAGDQVETLLGQGTVGLEFVEQAPELDNAAHCRRTRRSGRLCGVIVARLPASARRTRRCAGVRRQHDRGGFHTGKAGLRLARFGAFLCVCRLRT